MLAPNTILQSRYRIIHQLGHGGMGAVYQAMDENLSCLVAVKETFAETDEHRRAFRREAELLANLNHPALPRVMDHFMQDSGQFLVMQYIAGDDLAKLLEIRERPFPLDKVLSWADQLLDALEELHAHRPPIVHRDIKPSNLKLTPKGKILLLDFGLAKGAAGQMSTLEQNNSGQSLYAYTRHYAPLEQMRGAGTDPRSDLYSLAATLWSLLTAEIPPDALARVAEKEDGNADPLRPAHELNAEVPPAVSGVLHQTLSINRNQRPKSAAEMRQMLREAIEQAQADEAERARRRALEETTQRHDEEVARREREAAAAAEAVRLDEEQRLRRERKEAEHKAAEAAAERLAEERAAERQRLQAEEEERREAARRAADEARQHEEETAEHRATDEASRAMPAPPAQPTQQPSAAADSFAVKTLTADKPPSLLYERSAPPAVEAAPARAGLSKQIMSLAIVAGVLLLTVVALVWMRQSENNNQPSVDKQSQSRQEAGAPASDSNVQPVQPAPTATGQAEQGSVPSDGNKSASSQTPAGGNNANKTNATGNTARKPSTAATTSSNTKRARTESEAERRRRRALEALDQ